MDCYAGGFGGGAVIGSANVFSSTDEKASAKADSLRE
jgi:hypothetical protein